MEAAATTWTISYPEKFIPAIVNLPFVQHNSEKQLIKADSEDLLTTFQYEKIEDGCYLFVVDMTAVKNTRIALLGDRDTEYYCLSYQLIRGDVNKKPSRNADTVQAKTMSLPRICSFYNNKFDYETSFEKGSGVRAFIFCFTREWLAKGVDLSGVDPQATFMKVISKEMEGMAYFNDSFYKDAFDELNALLSAAKRSPVYHLVVRKLSLTLIADFFTIVADPMSVLNVPGTSEEFDGVEQIKKYIEQNFRKGFPGLPFLADVGRMTVPTMRRQFKRQLGRSAFDYFREVQMRYAFEQLQNGMAVKRVALTLGFKNPANFSRTFKAAYRILPKEVESLR